MANNLAHLQNLIKRDPKSYHEEFFMQFRRFESEIELFKLQPTQDSSRFNELCTFMAHVSPCYKGECEQVPMKILSLLEDNATILHPDVRAKLLQALILLRGKNMIEPSMLLKLAFKLFSVNDKTLRVALQDYILKDIKLINANKHNVKMNRKVQAMLYEVVTEDSSIAAKKTVHILSELYRRRIWTDARSVNVIASACLSSITGVMVPAIHFFLGIESKMIDDEDEEKKQLTTVEVNRHEHSRKTKKRIRSVKKQEEHNLKVRRALEEKKAKEIPLFPAIQVLHDPQSLAEKLFKKLRQSGESFEVKLLIMNFVSRIIGCHKLIILNFYSFLQRYMTSHQQDVTLVLAYLIQACHDLVPSEELLPIVKAIAYNFITERCSNEVIAVGINSLREIFSRVHAILLSDGMEDFIQDIALYSKKAHKSVMMASHGVINLVRYSFKTLSKLDYLIVISVIGLTSWTSDRF